MKLLNSDATRYVAAARRICNQCLVGGCTGNYAHIQYFYTTASHIKTAAGRQHGGRGYQ